ncbi:MAG TPA: ATP-binding protein, partial [Candidatus Babeliales bacterium]|nr:ATP-binding protein [Candidatus Babeliales bacterium]
IDEFQHAPELLSYIKVLVDAQPRPGYFVLTGSQNFLMNAAITESLAGRVGILTLLPLSLHELAQNQLITTTHPEALLFRGAYPRLYLNQFEPDEVYPNYIQTYLERDVRQLINVANLATFQRFLQLCAARIGQLLNISDLATACAVSVPTVKHWLTILEASYIIFLLRPYWPNFNKRLTKSPKLYFFDTGLVCSLLGLELAQLIPQQANYGGLFESLIISDLYKQFYNQGRRPALYFWRDQNGDLEIDGLIDKNGQLTPIEIKASETFNPHFFTGLHKWCQLAQVAPQNSYVVYGGTLSMANQQGRLLSWQQAGTLVADLHHHLPAA